jgi:protocatechuate 3,4-dioxygenase beta subunit
MTRSSKWAALLALAVAVPAWAQEKASVTGTVTNSLTGAPVLRAHVILRGGQQKFGALTNGEGKFSIAGIPPGSYLVTAERVGFAPPAVSFRAPQLALRAGDAKDSVDVKLTPVGAIAGRVLDADGEPIQSVDVSAEGPQSQESAITDNKGQYRIDGLAPGKYRLKATPEQRHLPPELRTDGSKEFHYMATFYPSVATSKGATRVAVAPGGEVSGIDIALLSTPLIEVSGKVLDVPAGAKGLSIDVTRYEGTEFADDFPVPGVKADGSFVIWGLDPGKYSVTAEVGSNGGSSLQSAPFELEVGSSNIEHVELRFIPPFDLTGQLQFEDEQAKEAPKMADSSRRAMERQLSLQPLHEAGMMTPQAEIGEDDSFKLENVEAGRYRVQLSLGNAAYVKSLRLGAVETDGDILDVRNGSGGGVLTLMVSTATGEINGTVSDSKGPVADAMVVLLAESGNESEAMSTDPGGHYSLKHLRPGKYRLVAGGDEAMMMNRGALEEYEDFVATVELHAGDKITQDLKQIPAGKL